MTEKTINIGIYGGTFDPPHIAHINLAEASKEALDLDMLFIVPTNIPPHKIKAQDTPLGEMRAEMCELAFDGIGTVSRMEILRKGASYTADTVQEFASMYPEANLYFIMGTDMLDTLEHWREPERILKYAIPAVLSRNVDDDDVIKAASKRIFDKFGVETRVIKADVIPMDSTSVRKALKERGGTQCLTDGVYSYIIKNSLYGAKPDLDWLRFKSYTYLKPKRCLHVAGCEEAAVRLARRWGADEIKAREAAILHDITKKLEADEQLKLCDLYGIITDDVERASYKLLHSKTGAELSKRSFGIDRDVYDAIWWHTTGKADMTLLEKIIYMADYIEMSRDFEGLDELRRLAFTDLDKAMVLGLKMSMEDVCSKGAIPHESSARALEYYEHCTKKDR